MGDWGRCAGSAEAYARLTHLWWILSCWGFQCYSCILGNLCQTDFSQRLLSITGAGRFFGVGFFGFPKEDLIPMQMVNNGWRFHQNFQRFCCHDVCVALRNRTRSTIVMQLCFSSLIYFLLMRRQTWALKSRLRAAEVMALANEITHSLCRAKRILEDELSCGTNDEQKFKRPEKQQCFWFVDGHLIELVVLY